MATFLAVLFIIICILLIIVVLLQKGRGGGIGAAFGGTSSSAFGTRTGDVFTWVTIVLTALFLLMAIGTTVAYRPRAEAVAPPVFDPRPGAIDKAVNVRLACQSPGARIYFTLDGSEPTEKSIAYKKNPVHVDPGQVLKARAYRKGWDPSQVSIGSYPKPPPVPTEPVPPTTGPAVGPTTGPTVTPSTTPAATAPTTGAATRGAETPVSKPAGGEGASKPAIAPATKAAATGATKASATTTKKAASNPE